MHIQSVRIEVHSNQSPERIARCVMEAIVALSDGADRRPSMLEKIARRKRLEPYV